MSNPSQIEMGASIPPSQEPVFYSPYDNQWTRNSQPALCNACGASMVTQVEYKSGAASWLGCLALTFLGFIYGCCLVPFCVDEVKDAVHFCSHCGNNVGIKKRVNFNIN